MRSAFSLLFRFPLLLLLMSFSIHPTRSQVVKPSHRKVREAAGGPVNADSGVKFVDVTESLGVHFKHEASPTSQKYLLEAMGSGVALFDCDNDGRLDIFFANGARIDDPMPPDTVPVKSAPRYWNRLYHQKADGTFEDITEKAGIAGEGYATGVAVGDYDNDGNEDLFVSGYPHNKLYRNNGHCTFTDVTDSAGVGGSGWSTSAAFVDFDNDGRLDLVVARYLTWSFDKNIFCGEHLPNHRAYCHPDTFPGASLELYRNDGDGHFTDVSKSAGVANSAGKGLGVAFADFDGDGRIDIAVANDSVPQFLYRNKGDGIFEDVALPAGVAVDDAGQTFAGMGIDFADYDNDGWPDIVITDLPIQRYALYRNRGDGTFSYESGSSGLGAISMASAGWGIKFMDFDNDGWKDLFIAQGHVADNVALMSPSLRYLQPPSLLRNTHHGFQDVSTRAGDVFRQRWAGRGLAIGDIDNDGDLDVVITTNNGRAYVLRNEGGNTANWLQIRLEGRKSNRDGIGAVIKIVTPAGLAQYATVSTAGSYLSASDRRVHFGLGTERAVASIEIRWPSGIVQRLKGITANQILNIIEADEASVPKMP
jgi:hypothetical protein